MSFLLIPYIFGIIKISFPQRTENRILYKNVKEYHCFFTTPSFLHHKIRIHIHYHTDIPVPLLHVFNYNGPGKPVKLFYLFAF